MDAVRLIQMGPLKLLKYTSRITKTILWWGVDQAQFSIDICLLLRA